MGRKTFCLYILPFHTKKGHSRLYTGVSQNPKRRYKEHKNGWGAKSVRNAIWIGEMRIIYDNLTRTEAEYLESRIKTRSQSYKRNLYKKKGRPITNY